MPVMQVLALPVHSGAPGLDFGVTTVIRSDLQQKSLLNKFLGAWVILQEKYDTSFRDLEINE